MTCCVFVDRRRHLRSVSGAAMCNGARRRVLLVRRLARVTCRECKNALAR